MSLIVTAAVCAATLTGCSSSTKSSSSGSSTGSAFFRGKTITLISPDAPGGSYDLYARLFAPYLAKALGATVNVVNIKGGGTLDGTDQMAAASPDGLTLGLVNVGGDTASLVEHHPGVNFDMSRLAWIGQPAELPNVLISQPSGGPTSFAALLAAKTPVTVLDVRNGVGDMLNRVVLGAFHIPNKLETGFSETSALKQGFLAHDGQLAFEAVTALYPLLASGEARPLLVTATPNLPSYQKLLGSTPTLAKELAKVKLLDADSAAVKEALLLSNLSDDFAAPAGLAPDKLAALRAAFSEAAANPNLRAQALKESLPLAPISGAALASDVITAEAQASAIAPFVVSKG